VEINGRHNDFWQMFCLLSIDIPKRRSHAMSSQVRIVKRRKVDESMPVVTKDNVKNEQQRNREVIGVIKSWIDEFKLRTASQAEAALILLNR